MCYIIRLGGGQNMKHKENVYRSKRLLSGMDIVKASEKLGISLSYLRAIEYSKRKPGREVIVKMSKLYKCSTDELMSVA